MPLFTTYLFKSPASYQPLGDEIVIFVGRFGVAADECTFIAVSGVPEFLDQAPPLTAVIAEEALL